LQTLGGTFVLPKHPVKGSTGHFVRDALLALVRSRLDVQGQLLEQAVERRELAR
jgi:hypothetical protein